MGIHYLQSWLHIFTFFTRHVNNDCIEGYKTKKDGAQTKEGDSERLLVLCRGRGWIRKDEPSSEFLEQKIPWRRAWRCCVRADEPDHERRKLSRNGWWRKISCCEFSLALINNFRSSDSIELFNDSSKSSDRNTKVKCFAAARNWSRRMSSFIFTIRVTPTRSRMLQT